MMEVCLPVALYFLLKATHMTAVSKLTGMLREGPAQGPAGQHPKHTDPSSFGPMFKQTVWVQHILQVAESQGRLSGLGGLFCFSRFCFILFNLCAICMNELLSIYKEPGSGGAITLTDPNTFLGSSCHLLFPVVATG